MPILNGNHNFIVLFMTFISNLQMKGEGKGAYVLHPTHYFIKTTKAEGIYLAKLITFGDD